MKPKEIFFGNMPLHKNLSQFLYSYHHLRDTKRLLDPIFQEFTRFVFLKTTVDKPPHQFELEIRLDLLLDYLKQETKYR
jgi:hypothetical protein